MFKKLLMLAVTSGLAARALKVWLDREARRDPRVGERADEQRWEEEGGNPAPPAKRKAAPRSAKATASDDSAGAAPRARSTAGGGETRATRTAGA